MSKAESLPEQFSCWQVDELLCKYPGLRLIPTANDCLKLAGDLGFRADVPGKEQIQDEYKLEIAVPREFPHQPPSVREIGGRIPASFHKLVDGSLVWDRLRDCSWSSSGRSQFFASWNAVLFRTFMDGRTLKDSAPCPSANWIMARQGFCRISRYFSESAGKQRLAGSCVAPR